MADKGSLRIVAGGDDNAINCTTLQPDANLAAVRPLTVTSAHASSVKGIAFLTNDTFVSSSTDQRLILCRIRESSIERASSVMTSVADVADLSVLEDVAADEWLVGISGIGLEFLHVT